MKKVAMSTSAGYNEAKRKITVGAWKNSTSQYFRASGAIFAAGFIGLLYGAFAGLLFANILFPVWGSPYGLVTGGIGGFLAGLVSVSLGSRLGYGLGGLLGGTACVAAWHSIIDWWVLLLVVAISTTLGIKIGSEIDKEASRWFLIDWLRDKISRTSIPILTVWQRFSLVLTTITVVAVPVFLTGWYLLH